MKRTETTMRRSAKLVLRHELAALANARNVTSGAYDKLR